MASKRRTKRTLRKRRYSVKTRRGGLFNIGNFTNDASRKLKSASQKAYYGVRNAPSKLSNYLNNPQDYASSSLSDYEIAEREAIERERAELPRVSLQPHVVDIGNRMGGRKKMRRTRRKR